MEVRRFYKEGPNSVLGYKRHGTPVEFEELLCPATGHKTACGQHCAWYDETVVSIAGMQKSVVSCKGTIIGALGEFVPISAEKVGG